MTWLGPPLKMQGWEKHLENRQILKNNNNYLRYGSHHPKHACASTSPPNTQAQRFLFIHLLEKLEHSQWSRLKCLSLMKHPKPSREYSFSITRCHRLAFLLTVYCLSWEKPKRHFPKEASGFIVGGQQHRLQRVLRTAENVLKDSIRSHKWESGGILTDLGWPNSTSSHGGLGRLEHVCHWLNPTVMVQDCLMALWWHPLASTGQTRG